MGVSVAADKRSLVHRDSGGLSVAFPDICLTPPWKIPVPYPNVARSASADKGAKRCTADGCPVLIASSILASSNGDEAGADGGVVSQSTRDRADMLTSSPDVQVEGKGVIRAFDTCFHNKRNTPPFPILQAPLVQLAGSAKPVCVLCGKSFDPAQPGAHVPDLPERDLHDRQVKQGSTEGGACLWAHVPGYEQTSCCHRWQAHQGLIADEGSRSCYDIADQNAWAPGASGNYQDRRTPFWHDVHHVIPPRLLGELIDAQEDTRDGAARWCRLALLQAGYNINHRRNVLLLPLTPGPADRLVLPRRMVVDAATLGIDPKWLGSYSGKNLYEELIAYLLRPVLTALSLAYHPSTCQKPGPAPGLVAKIALEKISDLVGTAVLLPNLLAGKARKLLA